MELLDTTLHMAVVFVDRFLSLQRITPSSLQLLGITCILIAAKYYERFPPQVSPDWIDNDIFCSSVKRSLALKQGMVCSVNVGYLTGQILHCVSLFFLQGVWLSLPDWQHLQSGTGVYYGEDSAEEIWIWPQYYWPSVNYGTLLTDCRSRQNGKHMQFTFIFKILIPFFSHE